ncbi:MAG: prephenate dehydrogenase/arogenate dehydrogenase family protein [Rhodospirillaceae bacterium]|nr:prephenate dehydrogenase/arogenate dehydrogenase family protein [Rhodospirillaceae bacterium]MDE0359983.1 prephenate dehydrogenase/arogenate dehydrogenase family protein [Rhodospirillaceae bacterium]
MSLDDLRERLSAVDRELISLVARRQEIVAEVSAHKMRTGTATRDYARERRVIEGARREASALGLDTEVVEQVMRALIRSSLTHQEQQRVAADGAGVGKSALIVGGSGKMGGWMAEFLASQGYRVQLADPRKSKLPYPWIPNWELSDLEQDIIVVAAPIKVTAEILHALAKRRPRGLVIDVGSLKTPLKSGFEALIGAGSRVASIHPMYGPNTRLLSGRHVIFVDVGSAQALDEARRLFESTMAVRVDMSLDDHDRAMAYVLGLSHALNLAFFTALSDSGELVPHLQALSSTTFDAQLQVASGVARDNPRLYFEIQALNRFGGTALDALVDAALRIRELVRTDDEGGFVSLMEAGRDYLDVHES